MPSKPRSDDRILTIHIYLILTMTDPVMYLSPLAIVSEPKPSSPAIAVMPKKIYGKAEKERILLEGEANNGVARRKICERYALPEQTYYRWRREVLAGRSLFGLTLASLMEGNEGNDPDEFADISAGDHMLDLPLPDPDPGDTIVDDDYPGPDDSEAVPPRLPQRICSSVSARGKCAVEVHGKLPRGAFGFVPLALPDDLRERLERDTRGSLNQVIVGLVRHALTSLDREGISLHLYNQADGLPDSLRPSAGRARIVRARTLAD